MVTAQQNHKERPQNLETPVVAKRELCHTTKFGDGASRDPGYSHQPYNDSSSSLLRVDNFSAIRMRFLRKRKCDLWCHCRCHTYVRAQTPEVLQSILGTLFVGYAGLPALGPPCSYIKCRRASEGYLQINYYFPPWFLARIVSLSMRFQDSKIPNISMRVLNVRDSYENIFRSALVNDAESVLYQLTVGQASVLDVTDDSGHSPLHVGILSDKF